MPWKQASKDDAILSLLSQAREASRNESRAEDIGISFSWPWFDFLGPAMDLLGVPVDNTGDFPYDELCREWPDVCFSRDPLYDIWLDEYVLGGSPLEDFMCRVKNWVRSGCAEWPWPPERAGADPE